MDFEAIAAGIEAGVRIHPEKAKFGYLGWDLLTGEVMGTCALGALVEGVYGPQPYAPQDDVAGAFDAKLEAAFGPFFFTYRVPAPFNVDRCFVDHPESCEAFDGQDAMLGATIAHLSDHHDWSREAIAAWVRSLV